MTFPLSTNDLPHTTVAQPPKRDHGPENGWVLEKPTFDVHYDEGLKVGYKWYDAEKKPVLFPFGYGLSYTSYEYSKLTIMPGNETTVTFTVKNTGKRAGQEIAQVYAALPADAGEPPEAPGGVEQGAAESWREQAGDRDGSSDVSFNLRRAVEQLETCAGQLHVHGRAIVEGSFTKRKSRL